MTTTDIEATMAEFLKAFNSGNVDGMLTHYAPGAVFVQEDGQPLRGEAEMRTGMSAMMAMKPQLQITGSATIIVGDIASSVVKWTLKGTAPAGSAIEMEGRGYDVMQKQGDGSWKMLIDSPWGASTLG